MITKGDDISTKVAGTIKDIVQNSQQLQNSDNETARQNIIAAASRLIVQLETPFEQLGRIAWGDPAKAAAFRTVFELGVLQKLGEEPMSSEELAQGTDADAEIIARSMKQLAAYSLVDEVARDKYVGTPLSMATNDPTLAGALTFSLECTHPILLRVPEYLKTTKYQVPKDPENCPWQLGLNTSLPMFPYLQADPRLFEAFNRFMNGYTKSQSVWVDLYPCDEQLIAGYNSSSEPKPMLVDIGCGLGQSTTAFRNMYPDQPGPLICEDTEKVVAQIRSEGTVSDGITPIAHNFFEPQPESARGARAYFLRMILHDWPDEHCRKILSHIRDAMKPGYSKLLINELVVNDTNASPQQTDLDWLMMAFLGARERTQYQWTELLESVGLKVVKIWGMGRPGFQVIEAVRAE